MSTLPTFDAIREGQSSPDSPLGKALAVLFEPSPILLNTLEPQLSEYITSRPPSFLSSYSQLIDLVLAEISKWDVSAQSEFISGHPRIGESMNLSSLSAKEQGISGSGGVQSIALPGTPPEVLARLKHLNMCYEEKYPGLRYITFVNGRSRAVIAEEMEDKLGIEHSQSPDEPKKEMFSKKAYGQTDEEWLTELRRAIEDVGKIAKSRLKTLHVE